MILTRPIIRGLTLLILALPAGRLGAYACTGGDTSLFSGSRPDTGVKSSGFQVHVQGTIAAQHQFPFHDPYQGPLSLMAREQPRMSFTATVFAGLRLWKGAAVYVDPELSAGRGLSGTSGVAGFPNGEVYRVGDPHPVLNLARAYLTQVLPLSGASSWSSEDPSDVSQPRAAERLELSIGKFALSDFFDANSYSHDPRTQFLNWALMDAGAWDYAADTRGYTMGTVAAFYRPDWNLRAAFVLVPTYANGPVLDPRLGKAHSLSLQWEQQVLLLRRPVTWRLILWNNMARMGNYLQALKQDPAAPDIIQTRTYGRGKSGVVANLEWAWSRQLGFFTRYSWNDGQNETWAFTEIDRSLQSGFHLDGAAWGRTADALGLAWVINGISVPHREYLAAGGLGFMLGDGHLRYGPESITELYYSFRAIHGVFLSPDYQFILHPGYNKDRGPVSVAALRLHVEW